jgi:hypothetical protein
MWRMAELIEHNPRAARRDLEEVAVVESPDLLIILKGYPVHEWAWNLAWCAQANFLLDRIDWQRPAPVKKLPEEELPSLMDYLQML